MAELIEQLWRVSWDMWEHRNGILFDKEQGLLRELQMKEIDHQFELGFDGFPRHMRTFISKTIGEVKDMEAEDRATWIEPIQAARI